MTSSAVQLKARCIVRDLQLPEWVLDAVVELLVDNSADNVADQVAIISGVAGGYGQR